MHIRYQKSGVLKIIEKDIKNYKLVVKPVSIELFEKNGKTPIRMLLYDGTLSNSTVKLVYSWLEDFRVKVPEEEVKEILSEMVSKIEKEAKRTRGLALADGDVLIFKATPLLIPFKKDLLDLFGKFQADFYPFSPYGDSYSFGATTFKVKATKNLRVQIILQFWTLLMKKKETIKRFDWFLKLFYMSSSIPLFLFTKETKKYMDLYLDFLDLAKNEKKRKFITLFDRFYFVFLSTGDQKISKREINSIKREINTVAKDYGFIPQFFTISSKKEVIEMYKTIFITLLKDIYKRDFKKTLLLEAEI